MIYILQLITALLAISFIIFSVRHFYCAISKKESKAISVMVASFVLFTIIIIIRKHLIKNELVENIRKSKIEQNDSFFSKKELSDIHFGSEKMRIVDKNIYIVLLPQQDTIYLNQDFNNKNKFWVHYKKYEVLKYKAPIGYIIKN